MSDMTIIELIKNVSTLTLPTLLMIVLWLGYKQVWVWGHQLTDMRADREFWRAIALRTTAVSEKAVTTLQAPAGREG